MNHVGSLHAGAGGGARPRATEEVVPVCGSAGDRGESALKKKWKEGKVVRAIAAVAFVPPDAQCVLLQRLGGNGVDEAPHIPHSRPCRDSLVKRGVMMRRLCVAAVSCLAWVSAVQAQCGLQWQASSPVGVNGSVFAVARLGTGAIIAGGLFTSASGIPASNIARWDGWGWSPLGSGTDGSVTALAALPNGDLVAAGTFTTAGGVACNRIARWDGSTWSPLGSGLNQAAFSLLVLPNGDVVVAGMFSTAGGIPAGNIAKWDGAAWTSLGAGLNNAVYALTLRNGDVVAGGDFTTAGGVPANHIARWNGTSWPSFGPGLSATVRALATLTNGQLVAGGSFPGYVARWSGAWSTLGSGTNNTVYSLAALANGNLAVGGDFTLPGTQAAQWNGTAWTFLGALPGRCWSLLGLPDGSVVAGGAFPGGVARTSPNGFAGLAGPSVPIYRFGVQENGHVIVAAGDPNSWSGLSLWDGSNWTGIGGLEQIRDVEFLPNGHVVFCSSGDLFAPFEFKVAVWDGLHGFDFPGGLYVFGAGGRVMAVRGAPNGDIIAGGDFTGAGGVTALYVARWNGVTWSAMPGLDGGIHGEVDAIVIMPNGDIVVGGDFWVAGPTNYAVGRWNGTTWVPLGSGPPFSLPWVTDLLVLPNGDLIAGSKLTPGPSVARWNGSVWSTLGSLWYSSLTALPNGDVVAATGAFPPATLVRWDGTSWSPFAFGTNGSVDALAMHPTQGLLVGGTFSQAGGISSPNFARVLSTCPAVAVGYGNGCAGTSGQNTLVADSLPWVDATFRATGTGLPTNALVLTLTSVTPIAPGLAPLTLAFPQAVVGCDVLTAPDILGLLLTTTGSAQSSLFLPNTPPLIGVSFYHQMIPIELDAQGAWISVTATNALQLTAGAF